MFEAFRFDTMGLASVLISFAICIAVVITAGIMAWRRNEANKRDTELKLEMVARGMSADDITRVLAAKSADSTLAETKYQKKA